MLSSYTGVFAEIHLMKKNRKYGHERGRERADERERKLMIKSESQEEEEKAKERKRKPGRDREC